ncbi:hypothetical protein MD484_g6900, partial [Candolleomyces efflorescens]
MKISYTLEPWYQSYRHPPFNTLAYIPPILWNQDVENPLYYIQEDSELSRLEGEIYRAVVALKNKFELPCVLPFLPNTLGYQARYRHRAQLRQAVEEAREWFTVWLGALSFCIAMARTRESQTKDLRYTGYPHWRKILKEEGLSDAWIDEIVRSPVGNFEYQVPRAGCILKTPSDQHQPPLQWFLAHHIPIWYRRNDIDRGLDNGALWVVGIDTNGELEYEDPPAGAANDECRAIIRPTWETFLEERRQRHVYLEQKETHREKERRLNRMRVKPVKSAKVFEWMQDDEDGRIWQRVTITQRCKLDVLSNYNGAQTYYDPFFNEWHCCEAFQFGSQGNDEEDEDDDYSDGGGTWRGTEAATLDSADAITPDVFIDQAVVVLQQEVEEVLGLYYGFASPDPSFQGPDVDTKARGPATFKRLLGMARADNEGGDNEYFATQHYRAAQLFVDKKVLGDDAPRLDDVRDDCMRPVRLLPRFCQIQRYEIPESRQDDRCLDNHPIIYVFQPQEPTVAWRLGVTSPLTALLICRLPGEWEEPAIGYYLCQRGIPFRVFHSKRAIPRSLKARVHHELPVRPWDYEFTTRDYEGYVNQRTFLLGQPHMQAMLRRGGIAWRLAIGVLGLGEIFKEPTHWGEHYAPAEGLVEDTVTTMEMDILCGAYECVTDDGKKKALKSWWPLVRYYEKEECGINTGRWCGGQERWFKDRVHAIQDGSTKPQPLSYTDWKSKLHGLKAIRHFVSHIRRGAKDLLESHSM